MTIPTQKDPMKLLPHEQCLYDSGVSRGRSEAAIDIVNKLEKIIVAKEIKHDVNDLMSTIRQSAQRNSNTADQLLISANIERDQYDLEKSRFTARSIAAIMEVTAGDRG